MAEAVKGPKRPHRPPYSLLIASLVSHLWNILPMTWEYTYPTPHILAERLLADNLTVGPPANNLLVMTQDPISIPIR